MAVDFDRLAIAVATHLRPELFAATVKGWIETAPTYRAMYVIVNHPDGAAGFAPPERCRVLHTGRPPEHVGCMAKTWNLAMLWAFRDPEVEWLLCSMDDVDVYPGWPEKLALHDADLYLAPAGDLAFLFNRRVLREVGWFDERFPVIGFQEWDWEARAIRALGVARVSMQDQHGWTFNSVGLGACWHHAGDGRITGRDQRWQDANKAWLDAKWGMQVGDFPGMIQSGTIRDPVAPETEWYPWFDRGSACQ